MQCKDPSNPSCERKQQACENCIAPPRLFRCDKTDSSKPQCRPCHPHDPHIKNCTDFRNACEKCQNPGPCPKPPNSHHISSNIVKLDRSYLHHDGEIQDQPLFRCDDRKLQCVQASSGQPLAACNASCSNSTPADLIGVYRGIQVQADYQQGEFVFDFSKDDVLIRLGDGSKVRGKVYVQGHVKIKLLDGPNAGHVFSMEFLKIVTDPKTTAFALVVSKPDDTLPDSLLNAMQSLNGETVYFLLRDNSWKRKLFSDYVRFKHQSAHSSRQELLKLHRNHFHLFNATLRQKIIPFDFDEAMIADDPCNQFTNCSACIHAHEGDLRCGWCLGGDIIYNATGKSPYKCAGYKEGVAPAFTCTKEFRTENCTSYSCSWNDEQPSCYITTTGQYDTKAACEDACKPAQMGKCNVYTKQCEVCSGPGCTQTMAQCQQICNVPHAKCNLSTYSCVECNPADDPDCIDTKGACDEKCSESSTYGICDPTTGQCVHCDPSEHEVFKVALSRE